MSFAGDAGNFIGGQKSNNSTYKLFDNRVFSTLNSVPVHAKVAAEDAEIRPVFHLAVQLGRLDESLCRKAPHVESSAAPSLPLYKRDVGAHLCQADGADVATRAPADDNDFFLANRRRCRGHRNRSHRRLFPV